LFKNLIIQKIIKEFLKKEFSEENIDFWVICENYKKIADVSEMKKEAERIWHLYLDTSSSHQINVDNKARNRCKEHLANPTRTMFELAQTQVDYFLNIKF
jgi:regulator of G-protein signaling